MSAQVEELLHAPNLHNDHVLYHQGDPWWWKGA